DLVRPGISLYGLYPSNEVDREKIRLRPAMTLQTEVLHVKRVPADFPVSYGMTYRTPAPTTLATVAVGYADGLDRLLSSRGHMLVHGRRAPIVGRVCMDLTILDVGAIPDVGVGDPVTVFGGEEPGAVSADEIADLAGTINYEVVSTIAPRVTRVYADVMP
ncbi:MAG: alanine racemase C-terminal domain-containing protein, partial [Desulfococcaceae bacterium]